MKQKLIPIASIIVGLLAFLLSFQYLRKERMKIRAQYQRLVDAQTRVTLVQARDDVPLGTIISERDFRKYDEFKQLTPRESVLAEEFKSVLGRKTTFAISKGDILKWSDIDGGRPAGSTLATLVLPKLRAVSLTMGGAAGVSGMIQPNDHVDVLGTFAFPSDKRPGEMETVTLTVLQDVTVLATGQEMAKQSREARHRGSSGYSSITLAVTPREAELLVFAQQMKGSLYLALRNPGDVHFEKTLPEVNFEYLQKELPDLNLYRQKNVRHKRNI